MKKKGKKGKKVTAAWLMNYTSILGSTCILADVNMTDKLFIF